MRRPEAAPPAVMAQQSEARRDGHKLVELFAAPESRFSDRHGVTRDQER